MLGDKQLQKDLKNLDIKLQRKIVRSSISKAMLPVRNKAKQLVPVDSGALRDSIKRKNKTRRGVSRSRIVTGTKFELGIPADAKGYYPAAIEYGTRDQPARSFLRRALTDLKSSVLRNTGKFIHEGILKSK